MAGAGLTPHLRSRWPTAQGMLRQMPFLPARADPNNLLCGSFCVGTKQPSSVHSNVCKQLLPLISTATLSKHTFPPAATSTLSCGQTPLNPIRSPRDGSQALGSLLCLPTRPVGIQVLAWAIPCSREPTGHTRVCIRVQYLPRRSKELGRLTLPRCHVCQGGQEKTLCLSPLLAKQPG